jgi:hypothetical protein
MSNNQTNPKVSNLTEVYNDPFMTVEEFLLSYPGIRIYPTIRFELARYDIEQYVAVAQVVSDEMLKPFFELRSKQSDEHRYIFHESVLDTAVCMCLYGIYSYLQELDYNEDLDHSKYLQSAYRRIIQFDNVSSTTITGFLKHVTLTIINRALCAYAVYERGKLEMLFHDGMDQQSILNGCKFTSQEIEKWVIQQGLFPLMTDKEQKLIRMDAFTWAEQDAIDACWLSERLFVLLYSLGFVPVLPSVVEIFNPAIIDLFSPVMRPVSEFHNKCMPYHNGPMDNFYELTSSYLWRLRKNELLKSERRSEILGYVHDTTKRLKTEGLLQFSINDDYPIDENRSVAEMDEDETAHVYCILQERLGTMNWISFLQDPLMDNDWDNPCMDK